MYCGLERGKVDLLYILIETFQPPIVSSRAPAHCLLQKKSYNAPTNPSEDEKGDKFNIWLEPFRSPPRLPRTLPTKCSGF